MIARLIQVLADKGFFKDEELKYILGIPNDIVDWSYQDEIENGLQYDPVGHKTYRLKEVPPHERFGANRYHFSD